MDVRGLGVVQDGRDAARVAIAGDGAVERDPGQSGALRREADHTAGGHSARHLPGDRDVSDDGVRRLGHQGAEGVVTRDGDICQGQVRDGRPIRFREESAVGRAGGSGHVADRVAAAVVGAGEARGPRNEWDPVAPDSEVDVGGLYEGSSGAVLDLFQVGAGGDLVRVSR